MEMRCKWPRFLLLSLLALLGGCAIANSVADPETTLRIEPAINVNPDIKDRPSPLTIRIFELEARHSFRAADFFKLYDEPEQTLGAALVVSEDIAVRPGRVYEHRMSLNKETRYIGVLAAFRDIQNARWRLVFEADPRGYDEVRIAIDRLTMKLESD